MQKVFALGLHKTGSSSLQMFLQRNQRALLEAGILFPPVTPHGVSRFLAEAAGRLAADTPPRLNEYMGHNALAYQMIAEARPDHPLPNVHRPMFSGAMALTLVEDLAAQSAARAVVFCSEDLARAALEAPEVPRRFAHRLGAEDVTLMITVRRPDQAIASWQTQLLRFGAPVPRLTPETIQGYFAGVHMNYQAALKPWITAFPQARLVLEPYDHVKRQGGSVAQFRAASGLALPDGLVEPPDQNAGLHPALFELARRATHDLERGQSHRLFVFLQSVQGQLGLPPARDIDMLGAPARAALARHFAPVHAYLSGLAGRAAFFDDADAIATPPPLPDLVAAARALPEVLAMASGSPPWLQAYLARLHATGLA